MLEALGLGLYGLVTDRTKVRPREVRTVSASASDPASLAVAFLNQLILASAEDGFLGRTIVARTIGHPPTAVLAEVAGEPFDAARHTSGVEVKAATLHDAVFDAARGRARVIVDI